MRFADITKYTRQGNWECEYSIKSFVETIEDWEKNNALILNPDFQRGNVWVEEQQIKFVEFILRGGSTAKVVYLNQAGWMNSFEGEFVCVDGLQRITALQRFMHNEIPVFGGYYKDYTDNIRTIDGMKINVNNLKTRKEVLQWYIEFNSGGTVHTDAEIQRVKKLLEECE